jgi:L-asparaginase/beta-aspartyl-peptidase (threonine type)
MKAIIVTHGGVGSPVSHGDGCQKAAEEALDTLRKTSSVLQAAVRGAAVLEDDPRFNAGTGSNLRIDGKTIEMDAAVMDSDGNFGAVAGIQMVKNPVLVAELVSKSPHLMLCGPGATEFARRYKIPWYNPITPKARERYKKVKKNLSKRRLPYWAKRWLNLPYHLEGCSDTIGIVVSDGKGNFAGAGSTGGTSYMLRGRIGDTPIIGSGIYVGKKGVVVSTGIGEEIIRRMLSKEVYEKIASGISPQKASDWGLTLFKPQKPANITPVGIIAVNKTDYGISNTHQMAVGIIKQS